MKPEIIPGHSRFGLILWVIIALAVATLFSLIGRNAPRPSVPKKTATLRMLPGTSHQKNEPNQAPEPTSTAVTPRADARVAPAAAAARL